MPNVDQLLSNLIDANNLIATALTELHDNPALAANLHWRDNLETTGYGISSLLSTED